MACTQQCGFIPAVFDRYDPIAHLLALSLVSPSISGIQEILHCQMQRGNKRTRFIKGLQRNIDINKGKDLSVSTALLLFCLLVWFLFEKKENITYFGPSNHKQNRYSIFQREYIPF